MNVLSKIIIPRITASIRYILTELEEMEREEIFRLKRVKQKKMKGLTKMHEIGAGEHTQLVDKRSATEIQTPVETAAEKSALITEKTAESGDPMVVIKPHDAGETDDDLRSVEQFKTTQTENELEKQLDENEKRKFDAGVDQPVQRTEQKTTELAKAVDLDQSIQQDVKPVPENHTIEPMSISNAVNESIKPTLGEDDNVKTTDEGALKTLPTLQPLSESKEYDSLAAKPAQITDTTQSRDEHSATSLDQGERKSSEENETSVTSKESEEDNRSKEVLSLEEPQRDDIYEKTISENDEDNPYEISSTIYEPETTKMKPEEHDSKTVADQELRKSIETPPISEPLIQKTRSKSSVRIKLPAEYKEVETLPEVVPDKSVEKNVFGEGDSKIDTVHGQYQPTKDKVDDEQGSTAGVADVEPYFDTNKVTNEVFEDIDLATDYRKQKPKDENLSNEQHNTNRLKESTVDYKQTESLEPDNTRTTSKDKTEEEDLRNKSSLTEVSVMSHERKVDYEADAELDETDVEVATSRNPTSSKHKKDTSDKGEPPDDRKGQ